MQTDILLQDEKQHPVKDAGACVEKYPQDKEMRKSLLNFFAKEGLFLSKAKEQMYLNGYMAVTY